MKGSGGFLITVSIKKNFILNLINVLSGLLFPLITFPYTSRILMPDGIGLVQFFQTIIGYIALCTALGIPIYAVREIARIKDNQIECNKITVEILLLHSCLTLIGYVIVVVLITTVAKIQVDIPLFSLQLKKKYNAYTYLMLKDIFPQNAVDLEFFSKTSLLYKMFRRKEKRLYQISDYIGCTSPGNIEFVLKHNKEVVASKLNICPNSVELQGLERGDKNKSKLLKRLMIPPTKTLFIYGGNLGKPQGVNFLLQVIEKNEFRQDSFIIVVGGGTDYPIVRAWYDKYKPKNSVLISYLPKTEYDEIVSLCDVGLVFLDRRFTVPNTPSRILPYMEYKMPILFATDAATDVGQIAEANNFGLWTVSGNLTQFMDMIQYMSENEGRRKSMGEAGYQFLKDNYTVEHSYRAIMERFK